MTSTTATQDKQSPQLVKTPEALAQALAPARRDNARIAFVPTMGALHDGHLALVHEALEVGDKVVVSIFVNPIQFGEGEDYASYPRMLESDMNKLAELGVNLVYAPAEAVMYPDNFLTTVHIKSFTDLLEGAHRPGHFDGVATIVAKLLNQVGPHDAFFGEKDYQQLLVIRQMAADLDMDVRIHGVDIVRDRHGLALSSRNQYLSADGYEIAIQLNAILKRVIALYHKGEDISFLENRAHDALLDAGFEAVDYITIRDAHTLGVPNNAQNQDLRVLAAAHIGGTRLIDNMPVDN
jgi:pantoate--beta-alanine ligase